MSALRETVGRVVVALRGDDTRPGQAGERIWLAAIVAVQFYLIAAVAAVIGGAS